MFALIKKTFAGYSKDRIADMGATTAYYAVFSLAPLLLIIIAILGFFFSQGQGQERLFAEIQGLIGRDGTAVIQSMVVAISDLEKSISGILVGILLLSLGATGVMMSLQRAFNRIWNIEANPKKTNIFVTLLKRLFSFGLILSLGFLLIVSLFASIALNAFSEQISNFLSLPETLISMTNFAISLAVICVFFMLLVKYLPDAIIPWKAAFIGGAVTTLLFFVGKYVLAFYLGRQAEGSPYGVATALIVVLLWINYSAQILFLGIEFTKAWVEKYKIKIKPRSYARFHKEIHIEVIPNNTVSLFGKIKVVTKVILFQISATRKALKWKKKLTRSKSAKAKPPEE